MPEEARGSRSGASCDCSAVEGCHNSAMEGCHEALEKKCSMRRLAGAGALLRFCGAACTSFWSCEQLLAKHSVQKGQDLAADLLVDDVVCGAGRQHRQSPTPAIWPRSDEGTRLTANPPRLRQERRLLCLPLQPMETCSSSTR